MNIISLVFYMNLCWTLTVEIKAVMSRADIYLLLLYLFMWSDTVSTWMVGQVTAVWNSDSIQHWTKVCWLFPNMTVFMSAALSVSVSVLKIVILQLCCHDDSNHRFQHQFYRGLEIFSPTPLSNLTFVLHNGSLELCFFLWLILSLFT